MKARTSRVRSRVRRPSVDVAVPTAVDDVATSKILKREDGCTVDEATREQQRMSPPQKWLHKQQAAIGGMLLCTRLPLGKSGTHCR